MMEVEHNTLSGRNISQLRNNTKPTMIENVDREYKDFKKGENDYAVSNAEELKELLDDVKKNIDTSKVIQNARKLLDRHIINAAGNWNEEVISLQRNS